MADITSTCTFNKGVAGEVMFLLIQTAAAAKTGDTIDLGSDTAAGVKMTRIHNVVSEDDAGAVKVATWAPATGIITLGTVTTGIHNLTVIGR
jgi:hypothetical protein